MTNHTESAMTLALDAANELDSALVDLRHALATGRSLQALGVGCGIERQSDDLLAALRVLSLATRKAGVSL